MKGNQITSTQTNVTSWIPDPTLAQLISDTQPRDSYRSAGKHSSLRSSKQQLGASSLIGIYFFLALLIIHFLLFHFITVPLSGGPIKSPAFAFTLGVLAAFISGYTLGANAIYRKHPSSCLISNCVMLTMVFCWSTFESRVEHYGVFGHLKQTLAIIGYGIQYDWPHYVLFLGCALVLIIAICRKKKTVFQKPYKRFLKISLLVGALLFVAASCFIINRLSAAEPPRGSGVAVGYCQDSFVNFLKLPV